MPGAPLILVAAAAMPSCTRLEAGRGGRGEWLLEIDEKGLLVELTGRTGCSVGCLSLVRVLEVSKSTGRIAGKVGE